MIAVLFEAWPAPGGSGRYLSLAAALRDELEAMPGFVSVERFESLAQPGKLLSLSVWRNEEAVRAWRISLAHRATQGEGRAGVFEAYRLRVAHVLRDYGMHERDEAPQDSHDAHGA